MNRIRCRFSLAPAVAGILLLAGIMGLAWPACAQNASGDTGNADDPKDIIADQIRSQGYTCRNPKKATEDTKDSRPNETVWILECEDLTYKVTLVPDMAARVETAE